MTKQFLNFDTQPLFTVRVAKKYLEEHPEEINGIGCSMEQAKAQGIGRQIIASFLKLIRQWLRSGV